MRNTRNAVLVSFSAKDMNFQVCLICFASNSQEHIISGRCAQDPSWLQAVRSGGSLAGAGVCSGRIPCRGRRVQWKDPSWGQACAGGRILHKVNVKYTKTYLRVEASPAYLQVILL